MNAPDKLLIKLSTKEVVAILNKLPVADQIGLVLYLVERDCTLCETQFFVDWVKSVMDTPEGKSLQL